MALKVQFVCKPARLLAVMLACLCAPICAHANALGLMEVVEAALQSDSTYQAAIDDANVNRKNLPIARAIFLPQLSMSLSQGKSSFDREFSSATGPRSDSTRQDTRNNVLQLRQTLFNLDAVARYRQAELQGGIAEQSLRKEQQDLFLRVATAYVEVLAAHDARQLARAEQDALTEQAANAESGFARGELAVTDAKEARARADIAAVRTIETQALLDAALSNLEMISGLNVWALSSINRRFEWNGVVKEDFEVWRDMAAQFNPELQVAYRAIEFFEREVDKQRAGHAPRLDWVASKVQSQSDSVNTIGIKSDVNAVSLQLQVPLFSGFAVNYSVEQAYDRLSKSRNEKDATFKRISTDLFKQYNTARLAGSKLAALDKAVGSAQASVASARLGIKTGLRLTLDLLNAQQKLFQTRLEYSRAYYESVLALLRLRAGTGVLNKTDLGELAVVFSDEAGVVQLKSAVVEVR